RNEIIDDKTVIAKLRKRIVTLQDEINRLKRRLAEDQATQSSHSSHTKSIHPNYHQDSLSHPEPPHPSHTSSPRMHQPTSLADYPPAPLAPANGSGLNREGRHLCARLVQGYVSGKIKDPVAAGISDFSRFRECLKLLRDMIIRSYAYHQKYNPTLGFLQREGQTGSAERSDVKGQETEQPPEVTAVKGKPRLNGSSKAYKSPFEKKRDKDISRLGRSVQSRIAEQKQQKRDLMEFKTILKQQQLENAIRDLGGKIGMTTDHLEKQSALVQRLRECKASREQITAEKIAEKQLAKRLAKYEKRFQLAQEHLEIVKNHLELQERVLKSRQAANGKQGFDSEGPDSQSESSNPLPGTMEHPTLNGQSHQLLDEQLLGEAPASQSGSLTDRIVESCRHKSGRVDSKRVLDILKTEEKKQNKAQKEIQKERIANFVQHFTLKEEATLSKLRHFKEQLKRQQQLQREEQRNGRGQSPSGVDHEANEGHHVTGMGEPCTDHVTGMGDPRFDHVQHAWAQGDVLQSRSRTSQSQMPHSRSNSQGGYPGAAGEKSGDSLTASPDDPSVFQPGSPDMVWSVERGKDVSSLSQVSQENRQCDNHHSTPDKDNALRSSSELTLPNGNDLDNNSSTSSPAQGTPTHPQLVPGTGLPNHVFVKTNNRSAASTIITPQRSSSSISSKVGSWTAMHEHEGTVPSNTSQEKGVPVINPVFHGSPAYETDRTSQPSSSITAIECSPPATMETRAAGHLDSVNSDMKAPSQSDLTSISSASGTSESAFQTQSMHSDSLASLRAAESLRYSSSSLGQGSFDAALASMLHQDRHSSRDSQAESLTSTLSSFSSPMQKVQQDQDVTTALKSRLLGYLADKPHSAVSARSANSSTSSQSSLHDRWSRTSTYTQPMTRAGESILGQGENKHLSEARGTPSVTSWDISSMHSDTSSPVPQNVSEIQSRGFKSNADTSFSSAVSPQTKASPRVDARTFDVELGSELTLSGHLVRDVSSKVRSIKETEGEKSYLSAARENKTRVQKIRKAVKSAEIIQKAWRKYKGNQPL
ncbi:uncharacterized protein, partial [Diadema antillarum]|uniref:uncharacterized protein n=1 Tax=Diadema antillarum TaxID=105358 RepID=UPI003A83D383